MPILVLLIVLAIGSLTFGQVTSTTTSGKYIAKKGQIYLGTDTILPNVGLDVNPSSLTGDVQVGAYINPMCDSTADAACIGMRIMPKSRTAAGHMSYFYGLELFPPFLGSSPNSFGHLTMLNVEDAIGADSSNTAIKTGLGKVVFGDSVMHMHNTIFNGAINYKLRRLADSVVRLSDTDHVLLFDLSVKAVRCTLPLISASVGREIKFIQLGSTTVAPLTILPNVGEKIETFDSLHLRSNLGLSAITLQNIATKWAITYHQEQGIFQAQSTNFSSTINDTGWYTWSWPNVFVRIKPIVGTSNSASFGITGPNNLFTISGLDSTYSATWAGLAYNNAQLRSAACIMPLNGNGIACARDTAQLSGSSMLATSWATSGTKGLPYGIEFKYRLPRWPY